jgi:hypothetical protein
MPMSPYQCCDHVDPISVENRIWVMGMELVGVILTVQGLCLVRGWEPWLDIIPKSKDRVME